MEYDRQQERDTPKTQSLKVWMDTGTQTLDHDHAHQSSATQHETVKVEESQSSILEGFELRN